jgi:hypothetical protein
MSDKQRIIDLQKALKIARATLEKIRYGSSSNPEGDAETALEQMWPLERKQSLQGLVGHAHRRDG